ncbi:hypothetical protein FEM48_Zijuj01G0299600 [Ziziphus jujuba var. spinosa]|uniref:Uncharacterized protein n=1 Tax=Ziziphus jujuba var. spinosa TaxID=714518 RepID=A0A978W5V8_ZIZJJ|nr:hypothetical protein FEM48_Zijuj01G0299600 [Ziziphus jujuba var. spinosa]
MVTRMMFESYGLDKYCKSYAASITYLLQIIVSSNHRAVVSGNQDRYSIAQFSFSNGMVQVPQELVDDQHPLKYKPFNHLGLLRFFCTDEGYKSKCPVKAHWGV